MYCALFGAPCWRSMHKNSTVPSGSDLVRTPMSKSRRNSRSWALATTVARPRQNPSKLTETPCWQSLESGLQLSTRLKYALRHRHRFAVAAAAAAFCRLGAQPAALPAGRSPPLCAEMMCRRKHDSRTGGAPPTPPWPVPVAVRHPRFRRRTCVASVGTDQS